MNILSIDTSGSSAGCAVLSGGIIKASFTLCAGLTHSEVILPAVDQALEMSGLEKKQLDCVAVVAGPGSFTGVRIGVCLAKGIAHAAGLPCARINALDALAYRFIRSQGLICPVLDARRDQVYTALYRAGKGSVEQIMAPEALSVNELSERVTGEESVLFTGDAIPRQKESIRNAFGERAVFAGADMCYISAATAAVLAERSRDEWMPPEKLTPMYLRKPQAERQREARKNAEP